MACEGKPLLYNDGVLVSLFIGQSMALYVPFVCLLVGVDVVHEISRVLLGTHVIFYFDYSWLNLLRRRGGSLLFCFGGTSSYGFPMKQLLFNLTQTLFCHPCFALILAV